MDTRALVDIVTLILAVVGSYLASVGRLETRIRRLEISLAVLKAVAVLKKRDRNSLGEYAEAEKDSG